MRKFMSLVSTFIFVALAVSVLNAGVSIAKEYDLVIINGRVMDPESNLDAVRNVGIKDDKIAVITKKALRVKKPLMLRGL